MSEIRLCREKVKYEGNVLLGIHTNVAGDSFGYTDGHAWVSLETPLAVYYYGLWPDGHPRVIDKRPECSDVRQDMELGVHALVSRYYSLTPSQIFKLNRFLNKPQGWGYLNTCAAWVADLMHDVVGSNVSAIDYFLFSTPRELGYELLQLEQKRPSARFRPRRGDAPEGSSTYRSF
jgi:hypothetical protein